MIISPTKRCIEKKTNQTNKATISVGSLTEKKKEDSFLFTQDCDLILPVASDVDKALTLSDRQ